MSAVRADGLGGPRVLVVSRGEIEIDRFRKHRYDHMVVVHARDDGSLDERVQPPFARALVTGDTTDPAHVRAAADYAVARLEEGGVVEFVDPTGGAEQGLAAVQAALPHLDVSVHSSS